MRNRLRDPRYRTVIERLIVIRDDLDVSQRDLAERLGQSRSYVAKVEIFERGIDFIQLIDWLRALGVNERKFLVDMLKDVPPQKRKRGS